MVVVILVKLIIVGSNIFFGKYCFFLLVIYLEINYVVYISICVDYKFIIYFIIIWRKNIRDIKFFCLVYKNLSLFGEYVVVFINDCNSVNDLLIGVGKWR